jgi:hypothetical protein
MATAFDRDHVRLYLMRVPAFLSEDLIADRDRLETTREILQAFCRTDPAYANIYGDKPVLPSDKDAQDFLRQRWERRLLYERRYGSILAHDVIVTGLSALDDSAGIMSFSSADLKQRLLASRGEHPTAGDLASHVFMNSGHIPRLDHPVWPDVGATNCRALGLWPEDLTQVADQAREINDPSRGVIMVCSGQRKAKALLAAITNLRPANDLVIDTNLAWELFELLEIKERDDYFRNIQ